MVFSTSVIEPLTSFTDCGYWGLPPPTHPGTGRRMPCRVACARACVHVRGHSRVGSTALPRVGISIAGGQAGCGVSVCMMPGDAPLVTLCVSSLCQGRQGCSLARLSHPALSGRYPLTRCAASRYRGITYRLSDLQGCPCEATDPQCDRRPSFWSIPS
jgi:hypothetical protein